MLLKLGSAAAAGDADSSLAARSAELLLAVRAAEILIRSMLFGIVLAAVKQLLKEAFDASEDDFVASQLARPLIHICGQNPEQRAGCNDRGSGTKYQPGHLPEEQQSKDIKDDRKKQHIP